MQRSVIAAVFMLWLCLPAQQAAGMLVNLTARDIAEAISTGQKQCGDMEHFLARSYAFGSRQPFSEYGIVRTKWAKLATLAGHLADAGRAPGAEDQAPIISSAELQIDLFAFGDRIDFAKGYQVQLMQGGSVIAPATISVSHAAFRPDSKTATRGFPPYRATIRCFVPYEQLRADEPIQVVLRTGSAETRFDVDLAAYR